MNLPTEYKNSIFHLIGLKSIKNEHREKKFHASIKNRYPQLKYNNIEINDTHKTELYIFDKCLFEEFSRVTDRISSHHSNTTSIFYSLIEKSISSNVSENILERIMDIRMKELELKKIQAEIELQKIKQKL